MVYEFNSKGRISRYEVKPNVSAEVMKAASLVRDAFINLRRMDKPAYRMSVDNFDDMSMWTTIAARAVDLNVPAADYVHFIFAKLREKSLVPPKPQQILEFYLPLDTLTSNSVGGPSKQRLDDVKAALITIDRRRKAFTDLPLITILTDSSMGYPVELIYCLSRYMKLTILAESVRKEATRQLDMFPTVRDFLNTRFGGVLDAEKTD